ncbi:uncharacterized protein TM35_000081140 [Trypanosoma theileri]|uniref:PRA1 family protein n=1 Tax=Trypanosoma theileri TaxID=67003 RepID=A0A1X0P041_9TRYP|nr:uncharacterized protein TM35_000081140 [Trypanosoma theileri]ORC90316.1 hypothetical protein TM35_000081140 [Trypanosoma theileri]
MSTDSQDGRLTPLRANGSESGMILVLSILWDASLGQQQRPSSEFFVRPSLPIRYMYMTRILVNLLWFSRNYFNWTLLISIVLVFFIPHSALILIISVSMHLIKRGTFFRNVKNGTDNNTGVKMGNDRSIAIILLMILQFSSCIVVCYVCGILPVIGYAIVVVLPVIAHALFTPYTDDAFELYRTVLRNRDVYVPMPRSPTRNFAVMDPTFEALGRRDSPPTSPGNRGFNGNSQYKLSPQRSLPALRQTVKDDTTNTVRRRKKNGTLEENVCLSGIMSKYTKKICLTSPGKIHQEEKLNSNESPDCVPSVTSSSEGLCSTTLEIGEPFRHLKLQMNEEDVTLLPFTPTNGFCSVLYPSMKDVEGEEKVKDEETSKSNIDQLVKSMESSYAQEVLPTAVTENNKE